MDWKRIAKWLLPVLLVVIVLSVVIYVWRSEPVYAVLWKQDAVNGFDNFGTATYENGVLYAPSKGNDKVYAVNASNGNIIWSQTVRQCDASPCIDGNVIYVGECFGPNEEQISLPKAMAINRTNGEEIWHYIEPNNTEWVGSPVVNGDYVYYTTGGTGVYALNRTNGNPIWHRSEIGNIVCSVAYDNGVVFVSAYNPPGQYALNATTGEYVWHVNHGASWDSSPVVYEGMVIQVARDSTTSVMSTYVLNETNGEVIREFEGKGGSSTPLVHNYRIIIPSYNCRIWAFDLRTGIEMWHTAELANGISGIRHPEISYCSPAAADGFIYYQSLSGIFYAIEETSGNIRWSMELAGYGFGSPSISYNRVFITNDSALYAIRTDRGSGDWPMFCRNQLHQSYS